MNKYFKFFLKIVLTILLLAWFLYRSHPAIIFHYLFSLPLGIFLLANIFNFIAIAVKSYKWHLLLPQYNYLKLLKMSFIGQYYSIVLPNQLSGEIAKIYILGKGREDSEQIAASVFIDKITGFVCLFCVGILGLSFTKLNLPPSLLVSFIVGILSGLFILFSVRFRLVYVYYKKFLNFLSTKFFNNIITKLIISIDSWRLYSQKIKLLSISLILGFIFQLIGVAIYWLAAKNLNIEISFFDFCWIAGILSILLFLPLTIGGIGVREGVLVGILGWLGVSSENALALSFFVFGLQLILALVGLFLNFIKDKTKPAQATVNISV